MTGARSTGEHVETVWTHAAAIAALALVDVGLVVMVMLVPMKTGSLDPMVLRASIAAFTSVLFTLVLFVFLRLKIRLGAESLRFSFGPIGHTVPYPAIKLVEATTYKWTQFGGWGIRWGRGGERAYNVMGDGGRAVRLRFEKGGREYTYLLSSRDPGGLADRIRRRLPDAGPAAG